MYINEKGIRRLSIVITVVIHAAVLLIPFFTEELTIEAEPQLIKVPLHLEMKPEKKPEPPKPPQKVVAKKVPKPKPAKKIVEQPSSLPGDRESPIVVGKQSPIYPKEALNNDWEGRIVLKVKVTYKGKVSDLDVVESTGHQVLDEAFIRTIRNHYTFKPRRVMGKDKSGTLKVEYVFKL